MSAVIIRKKDIDKLAKELLNEVDSFFNDKWIIDTFPEMKVEKKISKKSHFKSY